MRFSVALPTDRVDAPEEFLSADGIAEVAGAVERVGLDAVFVTDHPAPDGRWLDAGGHHAMEPTVALAAAAAATRRVLLHTHIYVLAYRNPFLAAKALAGVHTLSGGRLVVGIGPGYLRAEFAALGADFERRVEVTESSVALMRRVWSGEQVAARGEGFEARGVRMAPSLDPPPPLWFGGNSRRSMERAVRLGQGWSPFPTPAGLARTARTAVIEDLDDLADRLDVLRERCEAAGRTEPLDVCFGAPVAAWYARDPAAAGPLIDELGRMRDLGVTWTTVGLAGRDRAELVDRVHRFADEVVGPLG